MMFFVCSVISIFYVCFGVEGIWIVRIVVIMLCLFFCCKCLRNLFFSSCVDLIDRFVLWLLCVSNVFGRMNSDMLFFVVCVINEV